MKRWSKVAVSAVAAALTVSACAGSGGGSGSGGDGKELVVWLMSGSAPTAMTDELHKEFEAAHPGVKVKYEVQEWTGIQNKLNTALAGTTPPDVIELGNTQSPQFAAQKVLTDLTADSAALGGANWGAGLKASGTWDGKQWAVPFYAANRLVLYRKDLFEKANIQPPTSREEWLTAIEKLKAANAGDPDFQPLYLAGQNWYTLLSFIWDEGGDVASQSGTNFTATLNTPQAKAGLEFYKKLVEVSGTKAPKDADEEKPPQAGVFGKGKVGMIVGLPWEVATAAKEDPSIKDKISGFPIPGKTAGSAAPVFQGGSNLAIPAGSKNADLAKDYLKLLAGEKYQQQLVKAGMIPGSSKDTSALSADPVNAAMAKAATNGKAVPASPNWGTVEAGQNPIKSMLTAYLTGAKSLDQAVSDANTAIQQALSSGKP
ncbi:sugar ABC transporter substrate-binding protein [Crossiella equi]|nr:sugar ABC transporter substrate-binding protein [Crossiella equi]